MAYDERDNTYHPQIVYVILILRLFLSHVTKALISLADGLCSGRRAGLGNYHILSTEERAEWEGQSVISGKFASSFFFRFRGTTARRARRNLSYPIATCLPSK